MLSGLSFEWLGFTIGLDQACWCWWVAAAVSVDSGVSEPGLERRAGEGVNLNLCFDLELEEEEELVLADFSGAGSGTESTIRRAWERRVVR